MKVTFITGNQGKADFLAKHLDYSICHQKIDLDEIQSLELGKIAEHKARQAYSVVKSPVLVEDVALVLEALGNLPGPFIKWFEESLGLDGFCQLADKLDNRRATVRVCFAYFDGNEIVLFNGELKGTISDKPRGKGGFGFDSVFIPSGSQVTLAQMNEEELEKKSIRTTTVYPQIKKFLKLLDTN